MFWKRHCFCVNWQWPLVWRKDAEKSKADALKWQRSRHEKELADERAAIAKLIPRIVQVGARGMGGRDIYAINVSIDASCFGICGRIQNNSILQDMSLNTLSEKLLGPCLCVLVDKSLLTASRRASGPKEPRIIPPP